MVILLLLACETAPIDSGLDSDPCAAPLVTWDNFGEGFLLTNCQGCHASTSEERYGAPLEVSFDTEEQAAAFSERLRVTVLETGSMPPAGGVHEDDLVLLERWLECL